MNILVGCECSGALRQRFRDQGHNAWSCDLKPSEDDSPFHLIMEVSMAVICGAWNLIIVHPPCTALAVSGNAHYAKGKPKWRQREAAMKWTEDLWFTCKANAEMVVFENPVGVLKHTKMGHPTQYIQPYEYGDDASKKTGLWIHGLPKLERTNRVRGRFVRGVERFANQTDSGQNNLGPSPERATERSRTYPGIADAIVDQWGGMYETSPREDGESP